MPERLPQPCLAVSAATILRLGEFGEGLRRPCNTARAGGVSGLLCGRQTASGAETGPGPHPIDRLSPVKRLRKCCWPSIPLPLNPSTTPDEITASSSEQGEDQMPVSLVATRFHRISCGDKISSCRRQVQVEKLHPQFKKPWLGTSRGSDAGVSL